MKKVDFDAEFTENDNKIPIVLNSLIKKTDFDLKITKVEKRLPNIANFLKRLILIKDIQTDLVRKSEMANYY